MTKCVLAADIGGSKTDIAVFSSDAGIRAPLARATMRNTEYLGAEDLVLEFLGRTGQSVDAACIDVAGPVVDAEAAATNLPWALTEDSLRHALRIANVRLVNDLEATAIAVPLLGPGDLHTLSVGRPRRDGPVAVIAAGTGLGEAYLTWDGQCYESHASEGGHADFGPCTAQQLELLAYLQARFDHVSYELVCSGIGIQNLYAFLRDLQLRAELPDVAQRLAAATDQTPIIMEAGLASNGRSVICAAALDLFVSILGAECGNVALKVLATGGVYLGGGIPPRLLPLLERGEFMRSFLAKGRLTRVLVDVPVHVILSPAALMGAAQVALNL